MRESAEIRSAAVFPRFGDRVRPNPSGKGHLFDERHQFAWYLFLGRAFLDHHTIYDVTYGSRAVSTLAAIGPPERKAEPRPGYGARLACARGWRWRFND